MAVYAVPDLPKPAYLSPTTAAPFGTRIARLANNAGQTLTVSGQSGTGGTRVRHHYSKDQPWSADGALLALENTSSPGLFFLDGETYQPISSCPGYSQGDDRWHPDPAHAHERINVRGATVEWYDVQLCSATRTFTLPVAADYFGPYEGNPSWDGRYAALSTTAREMFMLEMDPGPGRVGTRISVNDCGLSSCVIDWVSVSPSGKYVVVSYDGDYPRVYDVDPVTLALSVRPMSSLLTGCTGNPSQGFIYNLGHADMTRDPFDNDEDVLIGQEHCGNSGQTVAGITFGHVVKVRLRDGAVTSLTTPSNEAYAHHISARATGRPGWVYVGFFDETGKRFTDEIIALKIDGSQRVERLAHKRSAFSGCYDCESHAVPSWDGLRVVFASNWMTHCGSGCGTASNVQAYVVDTRVP